MVVWDLQRKEVLVRHGTGGVALSALSWRPEPAANVLAGIGEDGQVSLWQDIIPEHMPGPAASLDEPAPSLARSADGDAGADYDDTGTESILYQIIVKYVHIFSITYIGVYI